MLTKELEIIETLWNTWNTLFQ